MNGKKPMKSWKGKSPKNDYKKAETIRIRPLFSISNIYGGIQKRWILSNRKLLVGRSTDREPEGKLSFDSDTEISRRHFYILWDGEKLHVEKIPTAGNPIFFKGEKKDIFTMEPGTCFTSGRTKFTLSLYESREDPTPEREFTLEINKLKSVKERHCRRILEALLEIQPLLCGNYDTRQLLIEITRILAKMMTGLCKLFAIELDSSKSENKNNLEFKVIYEDFAGYGDENTSLSKTLIARSFEILDTVYHFWSDIDLIKQDFTFVSGQKWASCTPLKGYEGKDYAFYIVGIDKKPDEDEIAIVSLIGGIVSNILETRRINYLKDKIARFFSPTIRDKIFCGNPDLSITPRSIETSVLFFDLRGFSKATETAEKKADIQKNEEIIGKYYKSLSIALTVATQAVFEMEGTIIDYQGDALLACWNAPESQENHPLLAVRAAIKIISRVNRLDLPFGADRKEVRSICGAGISIGIVQAGCLEAAGMIKYTLIGSAVNVASRLEGITKHVGVPLIVTEDVVQGIKNASVDNDDVKYRRIARVRPAGMQNIMNIYEIVLEEDSGGTGISGKDIEAYEKALFLFENGKFNECYEQLMKCPNDLVSYFLMKQLIKSREREISEDWTGIIEFDNK